MQNKLRDADEQIAALTKQLKAVELQKVAACMPSLRSIPRMPDSRWIC